MYGERKILYNRLAIERQSKVFAYVTGDRPNQETQIAQDAVELIGELLDNYEGTKKISLFLYTCGGETLAAWTLVNLLREFCDELEIIVPAKCHSSGTLICLGADKIVMTKQATLGPIDPSINTPLNPRIPGAPEQVRLPVSVEDIAGFFELGREEGGIKAEEFTSRVFMKLAEEVHPIALGKVKRARSQIQKLARKLLQYHFDDPEKIGRITQILCSEAGSHDYTIHRTEARKSLGLDIETPSMPLYELIKEIYLDIRKELELDTPFNPAIISGPYELTRVLVESQANGGYHLKKKGHLTQLPVQGPRPGAVAIQDQVTFEGWEKIQ
jgi:hypothetical protein